MGDDGVLDQAQTGWIAAADDACEQEPIHTPGSIQPFGVLLACRRSDLRTLYVSANCEELLGYPPAAALRKTLPELLGQTQSDLIVKALSDPSHRTASRLSIESLQPEGSDHHVFAHAVDANLICIELEPSLSARRWDLLSKRLESVVEALQKTGSQRDLCNAAVTEMRALTGHDHVMIYKFHPDDHGEVIAEDKAAEVAPHLDLHFPASDIPQQARALYLLQRTRLIADVDYTPVPVVTGSNAPQLGPLDMTYSSLRSISPIHLQYLRNMKVGASFSVSLVHDQKLWGLIICLHRTPLLISPEVRSLCDLLGQVISMLTSVTQSNEDYLEQLFNRSRIKELETLLAGPCPISETLAEHTETLLGAVGASGAVICIDGHRRTCGVVPPKEQVSALLKLISSSGQEHLFESNYLTGVTELLAGFRSVASGVLAISVQGTFRSYVLWFRPEVAQTIQWAGNPNEAKTRNLATGVVGPRVSFRAWCDSVSGHAKAWSLLEKAMALDIQHLLVATIGRHDDANRAKLSLVDMLTHLPNRRVLLERVTFLQDEGMLDSAALLFVDIDRFKSVNDAFGHLIGDELLIQAGARIASAVGPEHLVARLGGDEFVILCEDLTAEQAAKIAQAIVASFQGAFLLEDRAFRCTPSVGVAAACEVKIGEVADLLNAADAAMYEAKGLGGNQFAVFKSLPPEQLKRQMLLEQDLFLAISRGEMQVHYQPQITLKDSRLAGFEALLRWTHPLHGKISPAEFVPMAERAGIIRELGSWVLAESLRHLVHWRSHEASLLMAVNVSVSELASEHFVEGVAEALTVAGLPNEALHLEVTESILVRFTVEAQLASLQALGVKVAIDDFGTGYSSLSYLQRLDVSVLKLDRTFLEGVGTDKRKTLLFESIVNMAHALGLTVVAEGIEEEAQFDCLRKSGCDSAQGFLVSYPLPPEQVDMLLDGDWQTSRIARALSFVQT